MDKTTSSLFCAAVITAPHGLHGHVRVKCFLENPTDFKTYSPFYNEKGEPCFTVKKVVSQTRDLLLISLDGIEDRTEAEALQGTSLMVPKSALKPPDEGVFYHQDLIGLAVKSASGTLLGEIHALHNFGAGDIVEVKTCENKLVMLPFTHDFVPVINVPQGFIGLSHDGEENLCHG